MKRALLVIDVQNEYLTGKLPVIYPVDTLDNIVRLIGKANDNGIPVIYIRHTSAQPDAKTFIKDSYEWEIADKIRNMKHDLVIDKTLPGSFTGTELEEYLRSNDIDTIAICGYMSHMCCDTTSRQAFHLGFTVEFLSDATATLGFSNYAGSVSAKELHNSVLVVQALKFSKVLSTEEWISGHKL